ncbi:helix-turn-helix transcriptional regulator [Nonomuraea sp. NPDC047897]|uniref:helix-turn-helix transcriptional regulator n=1 Tax=Nonomuraea sp. NPDC047897 TaxID=3364346 RepID=UPI003714F18D
MEYEFCFVVDGASVDDIAAVEALERELDAMLFRGGGVDLLDIAFDGESALDAAMSAARSITHCVPQLRLLRLHRDLVGIPEIAERVGVTRQNVHQWVTGRRRHKDLCAFPAPEGTAGRAQVWLWVEVNAWLKQRGLDDGVDRPDRNEMADIDSALNCELQHRTKLAIERWRRNRSVGVLATYEATLESIDTEEVAQLTAASQDWSDLRSLDYRVAIR